MASEIRHYSVTVPAATLSTVPLVAKLSMPARIASAVTVRIPPGPRGVVGFQLAMSGQQIIPWNVGEWFVTDDEAVSWPLYGYPNSGDWQLIAYNTGIYDHTLRVEFQLDLVGASSTAQFVPLSPSQIANA